MQVDTRGRAPGCAPAAAPTRHTRDLGPLVVALVDALEETLLAARRLLVATQASGRLRPEGLAHPHGATARVWEVGDRACDLQTPPAEARAAPANCPGGATTALLTRREAEVLGLLAAGRSNGQIAAALCLSPRTVQRHVANLYLKIGAHCRAEATAYAINHGLR